MSENKNNQADTDKKAETKAAPPAKKKQAKKSSQWIMPLVILILVVIGGSYSAWRQFQQFNTNTSNKFSSLTDQIDKLSRTQKYQANEQQAQLDELSEKQNDLKRSFSALLKSSAHLKNDWLLAEAEYLVKLANHRLILEKDITTAITAMEAADERLREVADPALLEVRKVLLEQTQALRAVEQPDLTGMALQISAFKNQVQKLALKTPDPATVQQRSKKVSNASKVESWGDLPRAIWEDLKGLVTIRDHSKTVQPLIPPEQHYFLKQNLNLQLEQARLALLKGNNDLFSDSLATAIQWIETHFDIEQKNSQSLIEGLKALSTKNIEPTIPDISQSYKVLQQYRVKGFVPKPEKPAQGKKQEKKEQPKPVTPEPAKEPEATKPDKQPDEKAKKVEL